MNIDMHSHIIPESVVHEIRHNGDKYDAEIVSFQNQEWIVHKQGYRYPLSKKFFDSQEKMKDMKSMNLDFSVLSPAPPLFMYWLDSSRASVMADLVNKGCSEFVQASPYNFLSFATIPMQDTDSAQKQLEQAMKLPGLVGLEIGTSIEGVSLDDPKFHGIYSICESSGWPIFLHPYYVGNKQGMEKYYMTNLIGNPLDTTMAAASLIFGGVLDRFPKLQIILAHGGGYLPFQIGRLDKGYEVRSECSSCKKTPSHYLKRFIYDSITFNVNSLELLIRTAGPDNMVIGTDYPFDMSEKTPVELIKQINSDASFLNSLSYSQNLVRIRKIYIDHE